MKNLKTLFKAKKATSIVMLLVTLLTITINLLSCSSNKEDVDKGVPTVATVSIRVVDDNNTLLVGAMVILKQTGQKDRTTIIDVNGNYTFTDVPIGATISVVCNASQFISQTILAFAVNTTPINRKILMIGDATVKTLIPDPKFEERLISLGYDTAPVDGSVPTYKINRVTSLAVGNITDLTGIQDFKALETFYCANKEVGSVKLTNLDLSKNTALKSLNCSYNNITTLDLSMNTALTELDCFSNPLLTTLNLTKNKVLKILNYSKCTSLVALDLSQNTALEKLYCFNNKLTFLDVSKNVALRELYCYNSQLAMLDVSNNAALQTLHCYKNQLTILEVSKNMALGTLLCFTNQLTALDVSKNIGLVGLYCDENKLTILDLQNNSTLIELSCSFNKLTTLDVSKNRALGSGTFGGLYCNDNLLTTLNFKNGNNANLVNGTANFKNNASGLVIAVDDVAYSNNNWTLYKDAVAIYVSSF
jgi:hypothetical protein